MPTRAADPLPALPPSWPSDRVELGLADSPGGAAALRASAPFKFRYQYLAGGVNTGNGWSTWNPNGQFVSWYIADSANHGAVSVFPYYMLLQSNPATGGTEQAKDISNLANPATMAACYADLRLFFHRAAGSQPVILHVEPDLWGYIEQATATDDDATQIPASVASSGDAALAGLPNTAAGFARAIVRLRDQLAPNVILAYHLSVWGTNWDIAYSNSPDAQVDALAARAGGVLPVARRGVRPDVHRHRRPRRRLQEDQSTATAARPGGTTPTSPATRGSSTASSPAPAQRVVVWQIPLGNTKMRAMNDTWGHYQDNRARVVPRRPGRDAISRCGATRASWRCCSAAAPTGRPAPATRRATASRTRPRSTATPATSLSADDDGGYFRERAAAYYAAGGLDLGFGVPPPPPVTPPPPPPPTTLTWAPSATASPNPIARRHTETISAKVRASKATTAKVDVRIYDPQGRQVLHRTWDRTAFAAGVTRTFKLTYYISASRRLGTYSVRVGPGRPAPPRSCPTGRGRPRSG